MVEVIVPAVGVQASGVLEPKQTAAHLVLSRLPTSSDMKHFRCLAWTLHRLTNPTDNQLKSIWAYKSHFPDMEEHLRNCSSQSQE